MFYPLMIPFQGSPSFVISTLNTLNGFRVDAECTEHIRTVADVPPNGCIELQSGMQVIITKLLSSNWGWILSGVHRTFSPRPLFISAFQVIAILGLLSHNIGVHEWVNWNQNRRLYPIIQDQPSRPDRVVCIHHEFIVIRTTPSFSMYLGGIQGLGSSKEEQN